MIRNNQKSTNFLCCPQCLNIDGCYDRKLLRNLPGSISNVAVNIREEMSFAVPILVLKVGLPLRNPVLISNRISKEANDLIQHNWRTDVFRLIKDFVCCRSLEPFYQKILGYITVACHLKVAYASFLNFGTP